MTRTSGSRPSMTSIAEFRACAKFIEAMSEPHFLALAAQMLRHDLVDVGEHRRRTGAAPAADDADRLRLFDGGEHCLLGFGRQLRMTLGRPLPDADQMLFQPFDRI